MRRYTPALLSLFVPALLALPVTTPPGASPHPVRPDVVSLRVAGVDADALRELRDARPAPVLLTAERETRDFETVGVTWEPGTGTGDVEVQVRTRADGRWSSWTELDVADDKGPDDVSQEASTPGLRVGTAPLWVGDADGVQARVDVTSGPAPRDVRVELIDPGSSAADASLGAVPASTATAATTRPTIISRAQWGADESLRKGSPSYSSTIKVAFVHHTASTNNYTAEQAAAQVRSFYAYHTKSLGWSDIGYNFLVDKFGRTYEGRFGGVDRPVIGSHAGGFNSSTMGVSLMGTHTSVAPTTATTTAVRDLLAWKLSLHGRDPQGKQVLTSGGGSTSRYPAGRDVSVNVIAGHRETNATECPGDAAFSRLPALRTAVAGRIASDTGSPVAQKYAALGGPTGFLGDPVGEEGAAVDGRYRHYRGGSIYWSSATGAHEVHGGIFQRWSGLSWERGPLGYPVTDETGTPDGRGRFNHFQKGSVYWTPSTGAHDVRGPIQEAWRALGWERGPLGYPVTGQTGTPDGAGRFNHFQRGSVYWTASTGARDVRGPIRDAWARQGWERGRLGYPTTGEVRTPDGAGRFNHFQGGSVYWTAATGARDVSGPLRDRWRAIGAESGRLGYPVTGEQATPDRVGRYNHFQGGSVYWSPATGAHDVQGAIRHRWSLLGWERSPLGYPVTGELETPDLLGRYTHFQNGSIYWTPVTGAHDVRGAIRQQWAVSGWERGTLGYPTSGEYDVPGGRAGDFQGGQIRWDRATGATTVTLR